MCGMETSNPIQPTPYGALCQWAKVQQVLAQGQKTRFPLPALGSVCTSYAFRVKFLNILILLALLFLFPTKRDRNMISEVLLPSALIW